MATSATHKASAEEIDGEERLPVGAILLFGALVFAVLRQGAYHQWQHQVFAVLVGVAAAALLGSRQTLNALGRAALIIAPVAASTTISMVLSTDRSNAGSTVLEVAMVGVGIAVGLSIQRSIVDVAINAVLVIALIVAATAIWGVATQTTPWGRVTEGVWRGSSSLTYANAAASVCGPLALLTFARSALTDSRSHAVATVALTIGFASTQSRGGALALAVAGLGVVAYLGLQRSCSSALPIVAGVALGAPLLLLRAPTDAAPQTALVIGAIAVGLAVTGSTWPHRDRVPKPTLVLSGVVVATVALGLVTGAADPLTERLTLRSGTTSQGADADVLFGDRAKEWSTAWDEFTERPIVGHGPGVVDLRWEEDGRSFRALFVHNEYLEFAVTHGLLGIAALVASAILAIRNIRPTAETWPLLFAVIGFLLHSTVDFLWHLPALPVLFAVIAGIAVSRTDLIGAGT